MVETMPVFYKITVTAALSAVVQAGTYPELETRVLRYSSALPCMNSEGMPLFPTDTRSCNVSKRSKNLGN
jgi:hypothetical protein